MFVRYAIVLCLVCNVGYCEDLDLSVLAPLSEPSSSQPAEDLDLSIFRVGEPISAAAESMDLSVLSELTCTPEKKTTTPTSTVEKILPGKVKEIPSVVQSLLSNPPAIRRLVGQTDNPSRRELVQHLTTGLHANKFQLAELAVMSDAELRTLHDKDHAAMDSRQAPQAAIAPRWELRQFCSRGRCYTQWVRVQ